MSVGGRNCVLPTGAPPTLQHRGPHHTIPRNRNCVYPATVALFTMLVLFSCLFRVLGPGLGSFQPFYPELYLAHSESDFEVCLISIMDRVQEARRPPRGPCTDTRAGSEEATPTECPAGGTQWRDADAHRPTYRAAVPVRSEGSARWGVGRLERISEPTHSAMNTAAPSTRLYRPSDGGREIVNLVETVGSGPERVKSCSRVQPCLGPDSPPRVCRVPGAGRGGPAPSEGTMHGHTLYRRHTLHSQGHSGAGGGGGYPVS